MKTLFCFRKGIRLFPLWLSVGTFLFCGCAGVRKLSHQEIQAVQNHDQSLVLLRATWQENGTDRPVPLSDLPLELWQLGNGEGKMLIPPQKRRARWSAPSDAARKEGWVYAVLSPGNYYVKTQKRFGLNELHLSIPKNGTASYAGSLLYLRTPGKNFGDLASYSYLMTSNELDSANAVASDVWQEFPQVGSAVMIPYRTPPAKILPAFENMVAVDPASATRATVNGDNVTAGAFAASPFLIPGVFLLNAGSKGGGEGAVYCIGAGLALIVAGAPIAVVTSGAVAGVHHFRWKYYDDLLNEQVRKYDLAKQIFDSMNARLAEFPEGATNKSNAPIALQVQPCRILLRGDSHQQFNLEIAVRVRLLNTDTKSVIWDNTYVHSRFQETNEVLRGDFEHRVHPAATSHSLRDYKGSAGKELLAREFRTGAEELGAAIAESFRPNQTQ